MQDSKPFTAQTFSKAATEEMQPRTPHPSETVEAIMRKLEDSPLLTENEKHILFSHVQDGSQYAAPLPLSIAKDDDGHFCIAIADRKWKIMRHGIIGNGKADREEFHQAASDLVDNALPVSDAGIETVVLSSEWLENFNARYFYNTSKNYRVNLKMTLGQVAYEAFAGSCHSDPVEHPGWDELGEIEKGKWEVAGQAAYLSIGLDPSEINRELQVLAARKRMLLLRSVYCGTTGIGNVASDIALIAGPTPQPKP